MLVSRMTARWVAKLVFSTGSTVEFSTRRRALVIRERPWFSLRVGAGSSSFHVAQNFDAPREIFGLRFRSPRLRTLDKPGNASYRGSVRRVISDFFARSAVIRNVVASSLGGYAFVLR